MRSVSIECLMALRLVLAWLRALFFVHWTAHWQSGGPQEYGDHQLFSRLYRGINDEIDSLAEKLVAYYGESSVDVNSSVIEMASIIRRTQGTGVGRSLAMEEAFQQELEGIYKFLKNRGELPLGLDNFLQGVADRHETYVYLLKQRLRGE